METFMALFVIVVVIVAYGFDCIVPEPYYRYNARDVQERLESKGWKWSQNSNGSFKTLTYKGDVILDHHGYQGEYGMSVWYFAKYRKDFHDTKKQMNKTK